MDSGQGDKGQFHISEDGGRSFFIKNLPLSHPLKVDLVSATHSPQLTHSAANVNSECLMLIVHDKREAASHSLRGAPREKLDSFSHVSLDIEK